MAFSLNRAQVIGNLTRDPEARQTPGGQMVASFSVATNRTWTDGSGQRQEKADFHNVVAWGKLAEICSQYLKKGRKVFVEGRMQTREWDGEDGQKRYRTEIVAENIILLDKPGEGGGYEPINDIPMSAAPASASVADAPVTIEKEDEVAIDDLPF